MKLRIFGKEIKISKQVSRLFIKKAKRMKWN